MLVLFVSLALAQPDLRPPCGSPLTLPTLGPWRTFPTAPPAPPVGKLERDAYGDFPNELVGTNFIVKWGTRGGILESQAQSLLDYFEYAWEAEVIDMGHMAPPESDTYLFNVYIGDTGSGTPDGYGAAGYYNRDAEGYPMIVVAEGTLDDMSWTEGTAAHEFYHALQDATGRYPYEGDSAWYWEATAMWVEGEVLGGSSYYSFLFGFAMLPEYPLYFFDYYDTGALTEYRQYGAMIFPRYISEIAADWEVVRDSWELDLGADTPQDALAELLADRGLDFDDVFGDFAAHNAVWDYEDGAAMDEWVTYYADYYSSYDHREVGSVSRNGTDGLVDAPDDTLPQRYGYNVVQVDALNGSSATIRFEGAVEGSRGSNADWRFTVVQDGPTYTEVPSKDGVGEVTVALDGEDLYLVAAAVPRSTRTEETFAWSYAVTPSDEPADTDTDTDADTDSDTDADTDTDTDTDADTDADADADADPFGDDDDDVELDGGCGCTTGGDAAPVLAVGALALLARRRRARR